MRGSVDNVIRIPTTLDNLFKHWLDFLKPFHNLTEREMDVAATIIKHRHLLSKVISDEEILDKVAMSEDTKRAVREECGISLPHFQVIMSKLKKSKIILDNKVNPRFVPKLKEENGNFQLLLLFELKQ